MNSLNSLITDLTNTVFLNNPLYKWLISALIIISAILLSKLVHWISRNIIAKLINKTKTNIDNVLFEKIEKPIACAIIIFGIWLALKHLFFSEKIGQYINDSYKILIIINTTWLISRVVNEAVREFIQRSIDKSGSDKFDNSVVHTLSKTINAAIWAFGIIIALGQIGVSIGALITGLGIGGVALALASQDTIKNIFAGIVLFVDRPFKIGDRIKIDTFDGVVEDIGIRSVRIRTLDKRLITMSCSKVADSVIENVSSEPVHRVVLSLGLTYNTTPQQMQLALDLLKQMPNFVLEIKNDVSTYFNNYGDFALHITFIYYIRKKADWYETQSKVNLKILSLFNENNLKFAFPTNTVIIEQ
ncbi:MAG: mechanosensitive ion channel family protein [Bacteroidales bacterium]|jgi:MscS family membrane protein|nr:mechanosensitive ion channel family protein [Bacteroidales bacterium]